MMFSFSHTTGSNARTMTIVIVAALLASAGSALAAPPQLTGLSETTLHRSGFLELFGSGFGATQGSGRVTIGGLDAIVTKWFDGEIHAYVPEASATGAVPVQVVTGGGASAALTLDVTLRQPDERIQWRFRMDDYTSVQFITVAPDGTILVGDPFRVYALSPDGGLLWMHSGNDLSRPISLAPDGTIYVGGNLVTALHPDGSVKWNLPSMSSEPLLAGPNVGPDGNIYAVQDSNLEGTDTYGVFALDPDGNLLFENPQFWSAVGSNSEILFGENLFFAGVDHFGAGPPIIHALNYGNGQEEWDNGTELISGGGFPILDPSGRIVYRWGQIGMQTIMQDGSIDWITTHPGSPNHLSRPAVGPDGSIYAADSIGTDLWSLDVDGNTRWVLPSEAQNNAFSLGVTPDNSVLVVGGAGYNGDPYWDWWLRGFDPADGTLLWNVWFTDENGAGAFVSSMEPKFSNDSLTTYVTTQFSGSVNDYGYLYAIDTPFIAALDADADGIANTDDNCPDTVNPDQTDSDQDGIGDVCDMLSDDCADAIVLCPGVITGSTVGATPDGSSSCSVYDTLNKDVWYSYTPGTDGMITIDTCGGSWSNRLSIHSGCPGTDANELVCNQFCCQGATCVTFDGVGGQTYLIRLTGFAANEIEYTLTIAGPACGAPGPVGDLDGDGTVGFSDLSRLLSKWGPCAPPAACTEDLDHTGSIGFSDLNMMLANWGS